MKKTVICVDDEKIVLDSLKNELRESFSKEFSIEVAESAEEALEILDELVEDKYEIPVVISDYLMPNIKGDEFLIEVHKRLPKTLTIMLTGQATIEGVGNAINDAKLYRYISKPWEANDLMLTVKEAYNSYYREKQITEKVQKLKELAMMSSKSLAAKPQAQHKEPDQNKEIYKLNLLDIINLFIEQTYTNNNVVFQKAYRLKNLFEYVKNDIDNKYHWEIEVLILLAFFGCINYEEELLEDYFKGKQLEAEIYKSLFEQNKETYNLISSIFMLDNVSKALLYLNDTNENLNVVANDRIQILHRVFITLNDFDNLSYQDKKASEAVEKMKSDNKGYDGIILSKLGDYSI